jgi:lysophospholipase L1-like esterase
MIYVIGDSHVSVFSGTNNGTNGLRHIQPEFGTCYTLSSGSLRPHNVFEQRVSMFCPIKIGSNTAYNSFNRLPIIEQAIEEYEVKKSDYVVLCFGEIDIRNHIGEIAEKNGQDLSDSIKLCVDKYMTTVLELKNKGHRMGVYGPPASSIGWATTYGYKDIFIRNKMTLEFNEYLASQCLANDVLHVDITKEMLLPNGDTDKKFIMDDIHLSQEAMPILIEKFKEITDGH